jgi:hypothetical protein
MDNEQKLSKPLTPAEHLQIVIEDKRKLRAALIALPFEEKIRRIIKMQELSRELKGDKGKKVWVWKL